MAGYRAHVLPLHVGSIHVHAFIPYMYDILSGDPT